MIPVVQFDPASLSLWYDAHLIAKCRGADELRTAIGLAYDGDDAELAQFIHSIEDTWVQTRAAHLASSVWHEKRHFLDFMLTNYGGLRVRQFFEVYMNLPVLFSNVGSSKRILLPIDSNLDPIKREIFGIDTLDPRILQIAEGIERRKLMLADDRRPLPMGQLGLTEVGGEAVLEAIAYHTQVAKLSRVFGGDIAGRVQHDQPDTRLISDKYRWAYEFLARMELVRFEQVDDLTVIVADGLVPLLYASLACRVWKQQQVRTGSVSSYLPGERLASLAHAIRDRVSRFSYLNTQQAWDAVNTVSKEIFGRTTLEEMSIDIEHEARYIAEIAKSYDEDFAPFVAYQDYHRLRKELFQLLQREPEVVLAFPAYEDRTVSRLRPKVVVAASAGEIGVPPAGYERLFGYAHPETNYDEYPEARWWWAATRSPSTVPQSGDVIQLNAHKAWCSVISDYAPMAKLATAGLKCRVMLGPELLNIKTRIEYELGVRFVIDGVYAPTLADSDMASWYYITGHQRVRCELSFEPIDAPDGWMLDPWEIRLRPKLHDAITSSMEGAKALIYLTMWRDWSPWILHSKGRDLFTRFPRESWSPHLGHQTGPSVTPSIEKPS